MCIVQIFGYLFYFCCPLCFQLFFSLFPFMLFHRNSFICLIVMSIHLSTITILQETATPVIQDGNRESILLTIAEKPVAKSCHSLVINQSLYWQWQSRLYHYNPSSVVEKNIKTLVVIALQKNNKNQPFLVLGKPVFFSHFSFDVQMHISSTAIILIPFKRFTIIPLWGLPILITYASSSWMLSTKSSILTTYLPFIYLATRCGMKILLVNLTIYLTTITTSIDI